MKADTDSSRKGFCTLENTKKDIKSLSLEELKSEMSVMGEKPFRAKQIYEWMHVRHVSDFDEMTNISKELQAHAATVLK